MERVCQVSPPDWELDPLWRRREEGLWKRREERMLKGERRGCGRGRGCDNLCFLVIQAVIQAVLKEVSQEVLQEVLQCYKKCYRDFLTPKQVLSLSCFFKHIQYSCYVQSENLFV